MTRRNFNFGGDDEQGSGEYMDSSNYSDGYDDDEDEDGDDHDGIMDLDDMVQFEQMDLMEQDMNQRLLIASIDLAKDGFLWFFLSVDKKLKRVQKIYDTLLELVQNEVKDDSL